MAEETVQQQPPPTPAAPAAPELGSAEWLEQKAAEPDKPAAEAPAAPAVAQPADTGEEWWNNGFADAKHGFLRNRKGPEVEQAFRATETEMRRSQERSRANEALAQQANARAAALELKLQEQDAARQAQQVDPMKEVEQIFFEQGPAAAFARLSELNDKRTQAEAAKATSQQFQQFQQTSSDQARQNEAARRVQVGTEAANRARAARNVDQQTWENERGLAVAAKIVGQHGPEGFLVEKNWTDAYDSLYPAAQPAAVVAVPAAPAIMNPPGSHKAAPVQAKPNAGLPTLADVDRHALELLAEAGGVDPEKFINKHIERERRRNA